MLDRELYWWYLFKDRLKTLSTWLLELQESQIDLVKGNKHDLLGLFINNTDTDSFEICSDFHLLTKFTLDQVHKVLGWHTIAIFILSEEM